MSTAPVRFNCLVADCPTNKTFSLLTLFEHLCYHVKDKNLTSFFEYKCLSCPAFFTNKIFMYDHKNNYPQHKIEHIPCLDLETPSNDPQLAEAYRLITAHYLRDKFSVDRVNGIGRTFDDNEPSRTPTYLHNGYEPRTPGSYFKTPCYDDIRPRDFANNCANADLPRASSQDQSALAITNQLNGIMNSDIPDHWKMSIFAQMYPNPNASINFGQEGGSRTPARDNDMESSRRDSGEGPGRFGGGNISYRFEPNTRSGGGGGRGGDDRPRGCFNCGLEGHRAADCGESRNSRYGRDCNGLSGRGGGRGRGSDRRRGADRGSRGSFHCGHGGEINRSRSPPSNRSNDARNKLFSRDRSFSRSPQSD